MLRLTEYKLVIRVQAHVAAATRPCSQWSRAPTIIWPISESGQLPERSAAGRPVGRRIASQVGHASCMAGLR